jgi:glycosyltransferase involved in cell wall biosynthesis
MSEIIVNGENGYLYQKNNLNSFIKTLYIALDSSDNKIGKNARRTVVENYRWDKSANILRRVYEDLI